MRAGIAAFASLAVVLPHVVIAEIDRSTARSERFSLPISGDGPSVAILPELAAAGSRDTERNAPPQPRLTPAPGSASVPTASVATVTTPALAAVSSFPVPPEKAWPRFVEAKHDAARAPIVLAAADSQPLQSSRSPALPWAPVPAVPRLLTTPPAEPSPAPVARLEMPALRPRMLSPKGGALRIPLAAQRYRMSTRQALALSRRGVPEWMSGAGTRAPAGKGTDPIGDLEAAITAAQPQRAPGPAFIMPFENGRVSSLFNQGRHHPAIDLAGRHGSPVFATSHDQKVTFAGWRGGYGNAVITRDPQGREHLYGHLSAIWTRVGVMLAQGDKLGALGSTGYSTGPHVHYEVKDRRGVHINPVTLLFPRGVSNGYAWGGTGLPRAPGAQAALEPRTNQRAR